MNKQDVNQRDGSLIDRRQSRNRPLIDENRPLIDPYYEKEDLP